MDLPYTELGDGPALLLLHAGIAHRRMWDEHLEPFAAAGYRVLAVDLPGFGEAAVEAGPVAHWEAVVETMDGLGIERAAFVGSSFGAAVALRVAALHPRRVSSLLLFSAPAVPEPDPSPELLSVWDAEEEALALGDVDAAVEAVVSAWVGPGGSDEVRERIAEMQRTNYELHSQGQDLEALEDPLEDDPTLLAAVACPTLVAAGAEDVLDFRDAVADLAARLEQATTALIPGCGHLAPLEAPDQFRRLVLANL